MNPDQNSGLTGKHADFPLPAKLRQQEKLYSSAFFERSNFYSILQSGFLSFMKYLISKRKRK